jgi:hypothetical protein
MKLARTVEHTVDVNGMLDRMTPEQFNEWLAEYKIEPWGIEPVLQEDEPAKPSGLAAVRQRIGV